VLRQRIESMDHPPQIAPTMATVPRPQSAEDTKRLRRLRLMFLAPLAIFLIWEVITRSLVAYLADGMPEMAIRLRSTNATALLHLAEDKIRLDPALSHDPAAQTVEPVSTAPRKEASDQASDTKNFHNAQDLGGRLDSRSAAAPSSAESQTVAQIRSWTELALLNDPLNARAFAILGHLSEGSADEAQTKAFMQTSVRRSLLETAAVYWMMRSALQHQDYRSAISYADALLRHQYEAMVPVMPMLAQIAENPKASGELKEFLKANPPWRKTFFERLPTSVSDARAPLDILLSLKNSLDPPSAAELRPYLGFLIAHGFNELAYYTWLQFLPPEQLSKAGRLFNGKFESPPSGLPFDWTFSEGSGVTIQIVERPDRDAGHALFMEFGPGRINEFGVEQHIMLTPGSYQFRGQHKLNVVSERGLVWRIMCANTLIGESSPINGKGSTWEDFAFSFTIPNDCPAQSIQLTLGARSTSEQFASGSAWFDDLQIEREPSVEGKS
jgi:hypothetical protein